MASASISKTPTKSAPSCESKARHASSASSEMFLDAYVLNVFGNVAGYMCVECVWKYDSGVSHFVNS